jgi:DNA-binding transcriptional regulator YdaS (Cro superfamily)
MTDSEMEPQEFAERVMLAGGAVKAARTLGVGKDWVYRRISGKTPIRERDAWIVERLSDTLEPQVARAKATAGEAALIEKAKEQLL